MTLDQQLAEFREQFARTAPPGRAALYEAKIEELRGSFAADSVLAAGQAAPDFTLPDAHGVPVTLSALLARGPAVVTFYRGGWCPYCNLQLKAYEAVLPEIARLGGRLVAISPQRPDGSLSTAEANALTFDVLSDVGNAVARQFGLVFSVAEEVREAMRSNGKDLADVNGDGSWDLPVSATFVIAPDRRIHLAHVDVDYRRRLGPDALLAALRMARPS